jgi:protoporphyrin/coproporphyrin ferrochelatase
MCKSTTDSGSSSATGLPPSPYDAVLLLSFGGPEGPDDVMPFLENVVRGKDVPRERLAAVARQYESFGGYSPANDESRALLAAVVTELNANGPRLPVYWGNRNWHPLLADAVGQMAEDGVRRALAFATSAFGSYPTCRQYLEDIERARQAVGPDAPQIDKLRLFYNHPGFIEAMAERVIEAFDEIPPERRGQARLVYTAHSIPAAWAERSSYERQLREACGLVTELVRQRGALPHTTSPLPPGEGQGEGWSLVFQSRSGPPRQPWLGPDIGDYIRQLHAAGPVSDLVVVPIGFLTEHKEVIYDLDVEVGRLCEELGITMVRAAAVGSHPRLVRMIRELVVERIDPTAPRLALGPDGAWPDRCPGDCCLGD